MRCQGIYRQVQEQEAPDDCLAAKIYELCGPQISMNGFLSHRPGKGKFGILQEE